MRFIIAALTAFFVLMFDFDRSPSQMSGHASTIEVASASQDSGSGAVSFADRFIQSPLGSQWLNATAAYELPALPNPAKDTAVDAPASAADVFCRALTEAAEANEIPVAFFARLIWQESGFRANEISHAGAQGVAQFMPETAAELGLDDPFDALKALSASARLLRKLRSDFGNLGLAAAAYNAGSGRIQKWLSRKAALPHETREYVRLITGTEPEDWIEDADMLAIRADLPREAPCEGVGGLSTSRNFTLVRALPASGTAMIVRKAEAAERAERHSTSRARKRLLLRLARTEPAATQPDRLRAAIAGHAKAKLASGRTARVALRERSSS